MAAYTIAGDFTWTDTATFSTIDFNGLNAFGNGNIVLGTNSGTVQFGTSSGSNTIYGNPIWLKAEGGQLKLTAEVGQTIDFEGDAGNLLAINIGAVFTDAINIGSNSVVISENSASFSQKIAGTNIFTISSGRDIVWTPDDYTITGTGTLIINSGPVTSGKTLQIGTAAASFVVIGSTTANAFSEMLGSQVYVTGTSNTFISGQAATSTANNTAIYGKTITICPVSDCTALNVGFSTTAWTTTGTTHNGTFSSSYTLNSTAGNITLNAPSGTLNLTSPIVK